MSINICELYGQIAQLYKIETFTLSEHEACVNQNSFTGDYVVQRDINMDTNRLSVITYVAGT